MQKAGNVPAFSVIRSKSLNSVVITAAVPMTATVPVPTAVMATAPMHVLGFNLLDVLRGCYRRFRLGLGQRPACWCWRHWRHRLGCACGHDRTSGHAKSDFQEVASFHV